MPNFEASRLSLETPAEAEKRMHAQESSEVTEPKIKIPEDRALQAEAQADATQATVLAAQIKNGEIGVAPYNESVSLAKRDELLTKLRQTQAAKKNEALPLSVPVKNREWLAKARAWLRPESQESSEVVQPTENSTTPEAEIYALDTADFETLERQMSTADPQTVSQAFLHFVVSRLDSQIAGRPSQIKDPHLVWQQIINMTNMLDSYAKTKSQPATADAAHNYLIEVRRKVNTALGSVYGSWEGVSYRDGVMMKNGKSMEED